MINKKLKVGNVPNLRFPEFEEEWETKRLEEVAEKVNSGKTPLGGETVYTNDGVLFIRSQNVNNDQLELENSVFIPESINDQMKNSIVKPNDILLNITGASLGRSCVVPDEFTCGNVNQHVCIIRLNKQYNPRFIQPIFSSNKGQTIFNSLQTGSGREGLNFESIKGIKLSLPNAKEQQKVASFLSLIGERITTQSKIIEQLETLIKGVSQKLFSQKVRFKEFSDKWEEKTLGEVLKEPKQTPIEKPNEVELLTVKLHCKGIENTGSFPAITRNGRPYYRRFRNEILIGRQNFHNGGIGIVKDKNNGKICSNAISSYNVLSDNLLFVYFYISRPEYYTRVDDLIGGTGQKEISKSEFSKLKINLSTPKEQQKIADFLSKISDKIEVEKTILEQLETQKKYLLQQMFV